MSIKTLRKRIALVAVSALGVGLMSVVAAPVANAAFADLTIAANGGAVVTSATKGDNRSFGMISPTTATDLTTNTVATSTAVMYDTGTMVVWVDGAANRTVLTVSGGTVTSFAGNATLTGLNTVGSAGNEDFGVAIKPNAAGTLMTVRTWRDPAAVTSSTGGTVLHTVNVTVTTAANAGTFSASNSRVQAKVLANAATGAVTSNADEATASYVPNGSAGVVAFSLNDVNNLPMATSTIVSASATNGAVVSFAATSGFSTSVSTTYGGTFGNVYVAQGTANTPVSSTLVTLSVNGTVYATKGFKIVGDVDKIELTSPKRGLAGAQNAGAFQLAVKDSAGNLIAGITPSATAGSINGSVNNIVPVVSIATDTVGQRFDCVLRGTSTITYTHTNARNQVISSNALPVVCAGGVYKYTASLDAASYKQGSIATLTIKATDVDGNPVSDYSALGTAAGKVSITCGSQMSPVTAPLHTDTFTAGADAIKYTVGTTAGSYNCIVDLADYNSTATPQAAQTIAYTIQGDGSISNAEVLASIVKLIAAINKQIRALQKSLRR